jgi:hypothetical protein
MYLPVISYVVQYEDYCLLQYAVYRHIMLCCSVKVYFKYAACGHILKMRAVGSYDTSLQSYEATHCHVPEDSIIHGECNETFKSHIFFVPCNTDSLKYNFLLLLYTTRQFQTHNVAWHQV